MKAADCLDKGFTCICGLLAVVKAWLPSITFVNVVVSRPKLAYMLCFVLLCALPGHMEPHMILGMQLFVRVYDPSAKTNLVVAKPLPTLPKCGALLNS